MKTKCRFSTLALLPALIVAFLSTSDGQWRWNEDPTMFNPSGILVENPDDFAFVDLDQDGDFDLVIAEFIESRRYKLLFYENIGNASQAQWKLNSRLFDQVNQYSLQGGVAFCDLDGTGCQGMVTRINLRGYSGLWYWKNEGTFEQPDWTGSPDIFGGIDGDLTYPSFADLNNDGDLDVALTRLNSWWSNGILYYENKGGSGHPVWREDSTLFAAVLENSPAYFCERPVFSDYDGDGDYDLIYAEQVEDMRTIVSYENTGSAESPSFEYNKEFPRIGGLIGLPYSYEFCDIDGDRDSDLWVGTSWELRLYENSGDSTRLDIGREYVEMNGVHGQRPSLFDYNSDGLLDLIVTSNHESWSTGGRLISYFKSYGHRCNDRKRIWAQNGWFGSFRPSSGGSWPSNVQPILLDMDDDEAMDAVFGGSYYDPNPSKSHIFHFEDADTAQGFQWEEKEGYFEDFNDTDTLFTFPVLVDIDDDGDFDLLLKRDRLFTFYENAGSLSQPMWTHNEKLLDGVGNTDHYAATFADLDLDGDYDMVFGKEDGTLICYENYGDRFAPLWQRNPSVFRGIDVGQKCEPVFGDMDNDGDFDLILGNNKMVGRIRYFENRSFEHCLKGDINCDSALNVTDVLLCGNIIIKRHEPSRYELSLADFNDDGHINVLDVVGIVRIIVGMP